MVAISPLVLNSGLNTGNSQVSQSPEKKVYIDLKNGKTVDASFVSAEDLQNNKYIETDSKQPVYIDMTKEFSYQDNAVSTTPVSWAISMTAWQYEQYQQWYKLLEKQYHDDKVKVLSGVTKSIVDSGVNFPQWSKVNNYQMLKLSLLIAIVGKNELRWLSNTTVQSWWSITTSAPVAQDNAAMIAALMAQMWTQTPPSINQAVSTPTNTKLWFLTTPIAKEDTSIVNIKTSMTSTINGTDVNMRGLMVWGNGIKLRAKRTATLVNKMIDNLQNTDAEKVIKDVICFTTKDFWTARRFFHSKKWINTLADPVKFNAKFEEKMKDYIDFRLRNLDTDKKNQIIQGIYRAKNSFLQQHVSKVQNAMTKTTSSVAQAYPTNLN
jgi:hypothetical protein